MLSAIFFSDPDNGELGADSRETVQFSSHSYDTTATLVNAVLANVPQLLLSISYLFLNSLCTAMATAREWNSFGTSRKGLRVSQPTGCQRSTYFLQLPYKYGVPLAFWSGIMHWMLSQAFFFVRKDYKDINGILDTVNSTSACGFSPLSLVIMLSVFFVVVVVIAVFAWRQYQVRVPFTVLCIVLLAIHSLTNLIRT